MVEDINSYHHMFSFYHRLSNSTIEENEDVDNIQKVNIIFNLINILCNRDENDAMFVKKFVGLLVINLFFYFYMLITC